MNIQKPIDFIYSMSILAFALSVALMTWLSKMDYSIVDLSQGFFSEATYDNVDISARKNLIWRVLGLALSLFFLGKLVLHKIKSLVSHSAYGIIAALSGFGLVTIFVELWRIPMGSTLNLIYALIGLSIIYALIERNKFVVDIGLPSLLGLSAAWSFLMVFFHGSVLWHEAVFYVGLVFIVGLVLMSKFGVRYTRLENYLFPGYLLPLVCFGVRQIIIRRQSEYSLLNELGLMIFVLGIVYLSIYLITKFRLTDRFKINLLMVFCFGITIYAYYQYRIPFPQDSFELANSANALMRFELFDELPFLDYLSSHNLFDHLNPFVYHLFHDFDGTVSYVTYDFLRHGLTTCCGFVILHYLFRNPYYALGVVLLLPFNRAMFAMSLPLLSIVFLHKVINGFSFRRLYLYGLWSLFLVFWKIDVGFANLLASAIVLIWYLWHQRSQQKILKLFKAVGAMVFTIAVFIVIAVMMRSFDQVMDGIQSTLMYYRGDQSHGLPTLSRNDYGLLFKWHYFVFPFLLFFSLMFLLMKSEREKLGLFKSPWKLALIFLGVFYFANFQRGLVRHSLMSGTDVNLSSYVFLFIALFACYFSPKIWRHWVFVFVILIGVSQFRYAESRGLHPIFERASSFLHEDNIKHKDRKFQASRFLTTHKYLDFVKFIDRHFSDTQTFIDFTNTPMLYFHSKRYVPSYFNQALQNTVTDELQKRYLKRVQDLDVPVVVYRSHPSTWGDATDGIPNNLRYNLVAQYIFKNYEPYRIISGKEIWLRKDLPDLALEKDSTLVNDLRYDDFDLGYMPMFLKTNSEYSRKEIELDIITSDSISLSRMDKMETMYFEKLELKFNQAPLKRSERITLASDNGQTIRLSFELDLNKKQTYQVPINWIYTYCQNSESNWKLILDPELAPHLKSINRIQEIID